MSNSKCYNCVKNLNIDEAVQCDGCKRHLCVTCSGLTSSEIKVMGLKTKRTMLFLCPPCREGLFQVPLLIKTVEALRDDVKQMQSQLASQIKTVGSETNVKTDATEIMAELAERNHRACNVIVVGTQESPSEDLTVRKTHDENQIKLLLDLVQSGTVDDVLKVVRLGNTGGDKPRLMKVIFKSRTSVIKLLKNRNKLPTSVKVFNDQTPQQREELRSLRAELAAKLETGETNLTIKYTRGVPKITKITKN